MALVIEVNNQHSECKKKDGKEKFLLTFFTYVEASSSVIGSAEMAPLLAFPCVVGNGEAISSPSSEDTVEALES